MTFEEVGALVDALQAEHPGVFEHIGRSLVGVMWDGDALVIAVDRELADNPTVMPGTFRGYPVRVERLERPHPH